MKNGLFTILGVFALLLAATSAANAQTASGHVFTAATLTADNPTTTNAAGVDLSESVLSIVADARADLGGVGNTTRDSEFGFSWQLWDRGDIFGDTTSEAAGSSNDGMSLIDFNFGGSQQGMMQGGDLVFYGALGGHYEFTVRLYNDDNGVLFAADEVREANLNNPAIADGEFYLLTTNWTTTDTLSEDVFGYTVAVVPETETPEAETTTTDNDDHQTAAFIGGGMVVVGGLVWYLSGGNFALFATTPEFGYSITESGYSYNYGGRADFRQDRWHLYWTAGQESVNGDFGDFRYSSGGKWQGDIFAAAFSEKVQGETADYDLSLSADWTGGIWKISPAFAIDSVYKKGEFQTTNSFRINGEMRYDDWRFSASGDKTQMNLSAVLEF